MSRSDVHFEYSGLDHLHGAAAEHQLDLGLVPQRLQEELLRLLGAQGLQLLLGQIAELVDVDVLGPDGVLSLRQDGRKGLQGVSNIIMSKVQVRENMYFFQYWLLT